jgi:hypothetical protein
MCTLSLENSNLHSWRLDELITDELAAMDMLTFCDYHLSP